MTKNCDNKTTLLRDGTSQAQRTLSALLPSYVSVDERNLNDLIEFVNGLSKEINYYNLLNNIDGEWDSFFEGQLIDETNQKTEPHYALFIAFLKLFQYAQEDINTITQRHLDFYYREVLNIEEKTAIPDQVFTIFELASQTANYIVNKDVGLNAGEDASGQDLTYKVSEDVAINQAQAVEFKALFYNVENDYRLYASPIANSENGLGSSLNDEEPKWKTFGTISDPQAPFNSPLVDRPQAEIGFAFASPILMLAEGNRTITIELTVTNLFGLTSSELKDALIVQFSGEEEWIIPSDGFKVPQDSTFVTDSSQKKITIIRTLTEGQEAVVPYDAGVLGDSFKTEWPLAKVLINTDNNSNPYIYQKLKKLVINKARISVDVDGVKNIIVQNDQSVLDASKPFMPFGNNPVITSSFYIGSTEIFSKQISKLDLNITWKGLPEDSNGFVDHYHDYIPSGENAKRTNGGFRAGISVLNEREWKSLIPNGSSAGRLFEPNTNLPLDSFKLLSIFNKSLAIIPRDPYLPEVTQFNNSIFRGFLKLDLAYVDFGHNDYQVSFATKAINGVKGSGNLQEGDLVNAPYTPIISELSLNYISKVDINLENTTGNNNEDSFNNRIDQFFQIGAFGVAESHPFTLDNKPYVNLFPNYDDEGTLYIGIENLTPPSTLSVLFQVAEGSENPDLLKQDVKWSYLSGDEWYEFPQANIFSDSTNGLITSGIIVFKVPKNASNENTILPNGLFWIKASVAQNSGAIADMISIQTQAVLAEFKDNNNDPEHLAESLPADSITGLVNRVSQIDSVSQPYASFGGRKKEDDNAYYTRVSERLRHKNRAIMIWDYEHIVLEEYPKIFKIKCLNHTKFISANDINEISPGNVSLVVVSNIQNKNAVNPLKPKTSLSTLSSIHDHLKKLNPPCAELFVKNPLYEEIVTKFNVRLRDGYDPGFYLNQLNQDIKQFLAPWAYGNQTISFGGSIHASVIINFIDEQEYVDYITCFTMDQITSNGVKKDIQEAVAETSASILTSAINHKINLLETDDCECDDNTVEIPSSDDNCGCDEVVELEEPSFGIGSSKIGDNFIIGDGKFGNEGIGEMGIDEDFEVQ